MNARPRVERASPPHVRVGPRRADTRRLLDHRHQRSVAQRLAAAGCVAAAVEAGALVAAASDERTLETWVRRREQGEPLAWIVGTVDFAARTWHIASGVYVPRAQTEELVRRAATVLAASPGRRAADLCTGSGVVAAALEAAVPGSSVVGVDLDPRAVHCAQRNGVPSACGHLGDPLRARAFDVVTAVAPYVPTGRLHLLPSDVQRYEPSLALDGGADGLDLLRGAVSAAARVLQPGGWLLVELGADQDRSLGSALEHAGFDLVSTWHDDEGDLRGLAAQLTG